MDEYRKYEPVFGSWYLSRLKGKGSFGKVFEITREEYGTTYRSALKIITVPQDEDDVKARMSEGISREAVSEYYEEILKDIINENEIMAQLKGNSNIVSYEDHQIIPHENGIGYDILIRMELLTPLLDRMIERKLDEKEVVRLGIDMCKALETCHKKNIIHRDIKPQNIFISDNGDFKLGDFGIARTIEKTTGGMSKKGTYKYMAPEVFKGENYDSTVDIYSLGIVLYSLLNGNRGPFLPAPPAKVTHNDEEEARMRRFRGEPIPAPREAGPLLTYIIRKACANMPQDRYLTAAQMRSDLENYLNNYIDRADQVLSGFASEETVLEPNIRDYTGGIPAGQMRPATGQYNAQQFAQAQYGQNRYVQPQYVQPRAISQNNKRKSSKIIPIIITGVILGLAIAAGCIFVMRPSDTNTSASGRINLAEYMVTPSVSGYNGSGRIDNAITVDESKKQIAIDSWSEDDEKEKLDRLLSSVVYTADRSEGLSNGDTITIDATYDNDIASEMNAVIIGTETTIPVSGLTEFPSYLQDAIEYNGHYYEVINEPLYWSEAEARCEQKGGHLATITSADEQSFIMSLTESYGQKYNYWLGGTDEGHEGSWLWVTGEPWTYSNWKSNQPDNGGISGLESQNRLQLCCVPDDERYSLWYDVSDSGTTVGYEQAPYYKDFKYSGYICEWDGLE